MPSIDDLYTQLQVANSELLALHSDLDQVNLQLQDVKNDLTSINNRVNSGFNDTVNTLNLGFTGVMQGLQSIAALQYFANQVLSFHSQQNNTIICILENISRNTCSLLTEAHIQTGLETTIRDETVYTTELLKSAYPSAVLELERLAELRKQLEACCPPRTPPPACIYEPCEAPRFDGESPQPHVPEFRPVAQPPHIG